MRSHRSPDLRLRDRFPAPDDTFTPQYGAIHRSLTIEAIDNPSLATIFANGRELPADYGVGLDERVVELPWAIPRLRGKALDAGSSLNHEHVALRVMERVESLHIVTAAPEDNSFPEFGIEYLFADFRDLPFDDDEFDTVACISALEHVGMDNAMYDGPAREVDPDAAVGAALAELLRVTAPDGDLLITVPYGASEDHGWFRQYGNSELASLQRKLEGHGLAVSVTIYAYHRGGWQLSARERSGEARYRDWHADPTPASDLAAAARAVACIEARPR